jgi:phasin family protein
MFSTPEQFSAATKSAFESQLALMTSLTHKAFEGVEKLTALNINAARSSMEESNAALKHMLSAKTPQEFFALGSAQSQPGTEKAVAYARSVAGITSELQAELTKVTETRISEMNQKVATLIDDVTKGAPAGSESVVAMFKSALGNANAGYEQLSRTTKQAVATIEGNVNNAVTQMSEAVEKNTPRAAAKK